MKGKGYTADFKIMVYNEYKDTNITCKEIQEKYGINPTTLMRWKKIYEKYGEAGFEGTTGTNDGSEYQSQKKRMEVLEEEVSTLKTQIEEMKELLDELDKAMFEEYEEEE